MKFIKIKLKLIFHKNKLLNAFENFKTLNMSIS